MTKALVIDDEAPLTKIVSRFLVSADLDVEVATSGQEGLNKARTISPDVVIVDIMMPDMDGYQVCRQLRSDPRTARSAILVMSARSQAIDRQMAFQAGADVHMTKPFSGKALIQEVQHLLAAQPSRQHSLGRKIVALRLAPGAGSTTVATNLGVCLAQERQCSTVVVDMDLGKGQVEQQLGLPNSWSWVGETIRDEDTLVSHLVRHESGLFALPTIPSDTNLPASDVEAMLKLLRRWHDYTVIDPPLDLGDWAQTLLKPALVLLLLTQDPTSLYTAQAILTRFQQWASSSLVVWPVVNKGDPESSGFAQQVRKTLGLPVVATLPWSPFECERAAENQKPIVQAFPSSPLTTAYRSLAEKIIQASAKNDTGSNYYA